MKAIRKVLHSSTNTAKIGMIILLLWIFCALFARLLAPYGPNDVSIMQRFKPPMWMDGGSSKHILGTDEMGRDILARLI